MNVIYLEELNELIENGEFTPIDNISIEDLRKLISSNKKYKKVILECYVKDSMRTVDDIIDFFGSTISEYSVDFSRYSNYIDVDCDLGEEFLDKVSYANECFGLFDKSVEIERKIKEAKEKLNEMYSEEEELKEEYDDYGSGVLEIVYCVNKELLNVLDKKTKAPDDEELVEYVICTNNYGMYVNLKTLEVIDTNITVIK